MRRRKDSQVPTDLLRFDGSQYRTATEWNDAYDAWFDGSATMAA